MQRACQYDMLAVLLRTMIWLICSSSCQGALADQKPLPGTGFAHKATTAKAGIDASDTDVTQPKDNGLLPLCFSPLPLGSISAQGWLSSELNLMANGLAGHEHDFYTYVVNSSWLGGTSEYSALNEGFPYWFNGLVPLAYTTDSTRLKDQVHFAAQYVLSHQHVDGWLGPESGTTRNFWARMPLCLGLTQLAEANATSWREPIVNALHRFAVLVNSMLKDNYTGYWYHDGDDLSEGDTMWARVRVQDMVISFQWLYEKYPMGRQQVLLENMNLLYNGSIKWEAWYNSATYIRENLYNVPVNFTSGLEPYMHGVNVAQGLKAVAVVRRYTHNESLVQTAMDGVNWTLNYHGAASGTVLADERLDGLSPYTGSELCTAVEIMYSLSYLYQALGNSYYADLCETAAFNALPTMFTPDYWAHQYMAEPNQPYSRNLSSTPFFNVNSLAQTYGLEPHYPCCTVNHPQGLPKFLAAAFVRVGKNGLAHALLSPAVVETNLASGYVQVSCETNYPYSGKLQYSVVSQKSFDFYVRVPSWYIAKTSSIAINGAPGRALSPNSVTGLHKLSLPAGRSSITYNLESVIRVQHRANDTVGIYYGAILYALEISSSNTSTGPKHWANQAYYPSGYAPLQSRDWTMLNKTVWNLAIDPATLEFSTNLIDGGQLSSPLNAPGAPPTSIKVKACEIDWPLFLGSVPGDVPEPATRRKCLGNSFVATLKPYGSQKLHMAELPTIDLSGI